MTNQAADALEQYCRLHPRSPSSVRNPRLFQRGRTWIAILGQSIEEGIVGFGLTPEAALRAFDVQYLKFLRPQAA